MKGPSRKFKMIVLLLFILAGLLVIVFNEHGVIRYFKLKDELHALQYTIDSLATENKKLEAEIDSLTRKVPAKIEQVAREKYDMLRDGEIKVEVVEK